MKINMTLFLATFFSSMILFTRSQNVTYQGFYTNSTFSSSTISHNLAVGTTKGDAKVSNGSATYSIPLMTPPRPKGALNGIDVKLNYNSSAGDGPLGRGWSISAGVSVIERGQKTIGHDGQTGPSCTGNDIFTIDGQRLVSDNVYSSSGSPVERWYTESENFAEILSFRNSGGSIYKWEIVMKNGAKYFYGENGWSNTNSTTYVNNFTNQNLFCNKAGDYAHYYLYQTESNKDALGVNPVYYEYDNSNGKVSLLKEVRDNFGTIKFHYKNNINSNNFYPNGKKQTSNMLLDNITVEGYSVSATPTLLRKYVFTYSTDYINSFLTEVHEYAKDGTTKFNPTIFKYGESTTQLVLSSGDFHSLDGSTPNANSKNLYRVGDFNGDGYSDILYLNEANNSPNFVNDFKIFINNKNESYSNTYTSPSLNNILLANKDRHNYTYISDFNGDGIDDVIVNQLDWGNLYYEKTIIYFFNSSGNVSSIKESDAPVILYNGTSNVTFNRLTTANSLNFFQQGDFDGDGAMDYILFLGAFGISKTAFISYPSKNIYNQLYSDHTVISSTKISEIIGYADNIIVFDHDGDGAADILTIDNYLQNFDKTYIFNLTSTEFKVKYETSGANQFPKINHVIYTGDFNGDKKSDLLHKEINTNQWKVAYSTGNSFDISSISIPFTGYSFNSVSGNFEDGAFPERNTHQSCQALFIVADFNGDGRSDILSNGRTHGTCSENKELEIFYSTGNSFFKRNAISTDFLEDYFCTKSVVGDFNGDGMADINVPVKGNKTTPPSSTNCIFSPPFPYPRKHIYFNTIEDRMELTKIRNGLGVISEFSYEALPKLSSYVKNYNGQPSFQGNSYISLPLKVVTSFINEDAAGMHELKYRYKGATMNKNGFGFLGYREIETEDVALDRRMITFTNKFNTNANYPQVLLPDYTEVYRLSDNTLLQSSKQTFEFVNKGTNRLWLKKTRNEEYSYLSGNKTEDYYYDNTINNNLYNILTTDNYGNTISKTINYGASATQKPVQPEIEEITYSRALVPSITYKTKYEYYDCVNQYCANPANNGLLKKKIEHYDLPNPITTSYEYTEYGLVKKETIQGNGTAARVTEFVYEQPNNFGLHLEEIKNSLGQISIYAMNEWQEVNQTIDIDGTITQFEYDVWGKKTKTTNSTGSIDHLIEWDATVTNTNGLPSLYKIWDNSAGFRTDYSFYDKLGRLYHYRKQIPDGNYTNTYNYYDINNNITEKKITDNSGILVSKSKTFFDDFGRVLETQVISSSGIPQTLSTTTYTKNSNHWEITTSTPSSLTNSSGTTLFKKMSLGGELVESNENGTNTLTYDYNAEGVNTKVLSNGTLLLENIYNYYGQKTTMIDNSAGTIRYEYTPLGELYKIFNNNGGFIRYTYDVLGRKTQELINEGTINYTYYPNGSGSKTGKLHKVSGYQLNSSKEYDYDGLGRLKLVTTKVSNSTSIIPFVTEYIYDSKDRVVQKITPTGNIYTYNYSSIGTLSSISNSSGKLVYSSPTFYPSGQVKDYLVYNTLVSKSYDDFNHLSSITSPYINDEYVWDPVNMNLFTKKENRQGLEYQYEYDNFNRLTLENLVSHGIPKNHIYHNNGNIDGKESAATEYHYHSGKTFAVKDIFYANTTPSDRFSGSSQNISYLSFDKPSFISQGGKSITLQYGYNKERICATFNDGPNNKLNRYYLGDTEIDYYYTNNTNTFKQSIDYIYAGDQLVAMDVIRGSFSSPSITWGVQTDYQGTLKAFFDNTGNVYYQNFDAWGIPRDNASGILIHDRKPAGLPDWIYRGYTGQEHYYDFGLINLNARLYDPHNSRMLSPDNFVTKQTLNGFNRYSYANNNPLKYVDKDGNIAHIVIAAAVVGALNLGVKAYEGKIHNFQDGIVAFGIGATAGAVGAATGGAAFAAMGGGAAGAGGFVAGAAGGLFGSAFSTPLQSAGNTLYFKDPMMTGEQYASSLVFGAVAGGTINGLSALANGRNVINGNLPKPSPGSISGPTLKTDTYSEALADLEINAGEHGARNSYLSSPQENITLYEPEGVVTDLNRVAIYEKELLNPHIYSAKHLKSEAFQIMMPSNPKDGVDKIANIINAADKRGIVKEGFNRLFIVGEKSVLEVRVTILNGQVKNFDAFTNTKFSQ